MTEEQVCVLLSLSLAAFKFVCVCVCVHKEKLSLILWDLCCLDMNNRVIQPQHHG